VVTFLNPLLLYGLALIAVPIIIHFFITRRKIVLDWAAYEFVRRALLKKKNRVEKENLLQLILRILAIAFLAFALARALFGPGRASEHALLSPGPSCSTSPRWSLPAVSPPRSSLTSERRLALRSRW
jgi:hypothetical protein